ncbi:MAG: hypothetical protein PHZ09_10030 [Eubacteriales bacterium]|nr:hypothetical protein [Eubacteriales bacterium]
MVNRVIKPVYTEKARTYEIISKIAYLIGVRHSIFENAAEPPDIKIYNELEENPAARIIRRLCIVRTSLICNYLKIGNEMSYNLKNLHTLPQFFDIDDINQLKEDGVDIIKANYKPHKYLIELNRLIINNIDRCRDIFPLWLKWHYIKELFIFPGGTEEHKLKAENTKYYNNKPMYPYQTYINWHPEDMGNILYNDMKFVKLIYGQHRDHFSDNSKVSDAGSGTKNNIYDFIYRSEGTVVAVDCENADPYKVCALLKGLNEEELEKVTKIILYDDIHTSSAWTLLENHTGIPVERELVERVSDFKSLVDLRMTAGTCKEFYQNDIKSFIIISSDSDFWGLISALPQAGFLVIIEGGKCGDPIKKALDDSGIYYCFIDDFCTGGIDELKTNVMLRELKSHIGELLNEDVNAMMASIYGRCRIDLSATEKKRFYDKYIKTLRLTINDDGRMKISLGI